MKKNNLKKLKTKLAEHPLVKVAYSLLGTLGIYHIVKSSVLEDQPLLLNLLFVPSFIILFYYWLKIAKLNSKSRIIFHLLFSLLMSSIFIIGGQLNNLSQILWGFPTLIKIILGIFAIFPLLELFYALLSDKLFRPSFVINKKHRLIAFLLPFITCLIVWIIFFPGVYTYDMAKWDELLSAGTLTSHWSITYGYFLRFFLTIGHSLFNNYESGFAIAMFIQLVFICYVIYRVIIFSTIKTKNKATFFISLLFFILTPFIATMSITDAQDTAFGGFFVLLVLELYSIIHEPNYLKKKGNIFKLILISFILVTLRNNGILCLLLLLTFTLFVKIPNKKLLLLSLLAVLILNFIYTGPIFQILNVRKNTTAVREILGVPSQQIARSYYENPTSFTEENLQQLNEFYKLEGHKFSDYQKYPLISDFTKASLRLDYTNNHLPDYLVFWAKIGIKNPGNYIEAFLLNSMGFWYPIKNYDDPRIKLGYMNYSGFAMTSIDPTNSNTKLVERLLPDNDVTKNLDETIFNNGWYNMPVIATLSSIGFYSTVFLYTLGLLITKKTYKLLVVLSPVIGLFITLLVAPVAIYRYAFPIALLVPLFICIIISTRQNRSS